MRFLKTSAAGALATADESISPFSDVEGRKTLRQEFGPLREKL